MKRGLALLLALVLTFALAGSVVAEDPTQLSGTIDHWVWGDYEEKGAIDFNNYYPNVNVNYVHIAQDEFNQKLQSTVVSGLELPAVVNLEMTPRAMLISLDFLERLDAEPYNLNPDDLAPFCLPLISNEKGEIVCVQIDNCVGGYVYNRELAKKYFGTDDPEEMEKLFPDLDSVIAAADKVVSAGDGDILYAGVDDAFMAAFGLYTKEPLVVDGKLNLDYAYLPSYQFLEKLVTANAVDRYIQWSPAWNTAFAKNNIVFWAGPSWYISFVIKANDPDAQGKYGLFTPPGGGFSWGGTAYGIPKSVSPEQKMLAWEYIKWFTMSVEGNASFVREQQTPTLYLPSYSTDIYEGNEDPYFAGQDVVSKLLEIAQNPNTSVRPMTKYDESISNANNEVMREIENGMSAEDALELLKQKVLEMNPDLTA